LRDEAESCFSTVSGLYNPWQLMSRSKAIFAGLLAGILAGIIMTVVMLVLACFGVATPLSIIGDRLSVFIKPEPFLALMGRVGGYNHLKQLGVGSTMAGQILVGGLAGIVYGMAMRHRARKGSALATVSVFVLLPLAACAGLLWPVLGTNYRGLPIKPATAITLLGLGFAFVAFERTIVLGFRFLAQSRKSPDEWEFSPGLGRRAFMLSGLGILIAGGGARLLLSLYRAATFSYDGTQYKGPNVRPVTPNEQFYCVTKNIVDPRVEVSRWRLEVTGLVKNHQTYNLQRLKALPAVSQETTLMCISNGLDAGLMSNAVWRGVPMHVLLSAAAPLSGAARVRLHGVDNYTDTFPFEKAMDPTTLVAFEMNGEPLPDRHGFPARVIVPGYFGEKHVKWLTRIEVADANARGFYETQGWGPDFIVPTRSRIDVPYNETWMKRAEVINGIAVRGVAFGGDRGISKVEMSFDDGRTWIAAKLDYPGTRLTWALWSCDWRPENAGDYSLVVRATDGQGDLQEDDEDRPFKSGATGFHRIAVHVMA
jgi:DMSO/TMAO reductase YedYZ molybdopterin-dependent catalytic subunit